MALFTKIDHMKEQLANDFVNKAETIESVHAQLKDTAGTFIEQLMHFYDHNTDTWCEWANENFEAEEKAYLLNTRAGILQMMETAK